MYIFDIAKKKVTIRIRHKLRSKFVDNTGKKKFGCVTGWCSRKKVPFMLFYSMINKMNIKNTMLCVTIYKQHAGQNLILFTFFYVLCKKKVLKRLSVLMDLYALGCPKHDFTIFTKCLSVCDTNFVAALEQKLMCEGAWNLIFSCILLQIGAD